MAGPGLPVTIDATYADSPADSSVKTHQQHHDVLHRFVDRFDVDAVPDDGEAWLWSAADNLFIPAPVSTGTTPGGTPGTVTMANAPSGSIFRIVYAGGWPFTRPSSRTDIYFDLFGAPTGVALPPWLISGDGSSNYEWVRAGLNAERLALNITTLKQNTIYIATDGAATPKPWFVNVNATTGAKFWDFLASANHHADSHKSGSTDPMIYSDIGAAPATNITIDMLAPALRTLIENAVQAGTGGNSSGGTAATTIVQSAVPLAAGDTFQSGPIDTTGTTATTISVTSDVGFTCRLDTGTNGTTWTTGTVNTAAAATGGGFAVSGTFTTTTQYVRLVVICGATSMSRLNATTIAVLSSTPTP